MPGANTLAYLALSLATKKKSFITLTPGQRAAAATSRIVPVHAVGDARMAAIGVPASAAAAPGIEVLFRDVLRRRVADSCSVAVLGPDGAVAAALDVFLDLDVAAD